MENTDKLTKSSSIALLKFLSLKSDLFVCMYRGKEVMALRACLVLNLQETET